MIKAGDRVYIKPEYQDTGDDVMVWTAVTDEEKGRVDIQSDAFADWTIKPIQTVTVDMLTKGE